MRFIKFLVYTLLKEKETFILLFLCYYNETLKFI